MIPAGLEKLVLTGRATTGTYVIGGSGVGTIPYPAGIHAMVVYGFTWTPFNDSLALFSPKQPRDFVERMIKYMTLWTQERKHNFAFRDGITNNQTGEVTRTIAMPTLDQSKSYDCYVMSKKDIFVNIYVLPRIQELQFNNDAIPLETQEQRATSGYGGLSAIRSINIGAAGPNQVTVSCMGINRDPAGVPAIDLNANTRDQFICNVRAISILNNPDDDVASTQYAFPLVTFKVCYINEVPTDKFMST